MQRPQVGVAVVVLRDGRFLMGFRKGAHGAGTWSLPGGHLEHGESFEQTARREVAEETGVEITNVRFGAVTNDVFDAARHYVTIWMISDHLRGSPQVREPDKFVDLRWIAPPTMPDPLFLPMRNLLHHHDLDQLLGLPPAPVR
ncbi:NUDIX domain-containing protein [Solwaraspora sp. WMMD791]|uniref:nucleotide triphosphate diphosphatase NUDT15 n=1 Tax=Solwaraspora sp. WMMD791 TaxID=3016086 RepID=UPI00249CACEC|nr:NUDIX domain-containing protein [Solwaraspora sp. WMMD791]WFE26348.1 NUDIX domain-containing protein [Solwaraspora sp. WMMD791]